MVFRIQRVSVPLGVIGIIYESRPNVTADAAALCLKSGNAAILRGGSESFHSSQAIYQVLLTRGHGLSWQMLMQTLRTNDSDDRPRGGWLPVVVNGQAWIDVVVPRGGKSLIKRVQDEARVPVIGHLEGICHVYLHEACGFADMARDIVLNAKMRRTGICGAAETVLTGSVGGRSELLPVVAPAALSSTQAVKFAVTMTVSRDCFQLQVVAVCDEDWSTEYLDAIISHTRGRWHRPGH